MRGIGLVAIVAAGFATAAGAETIHVTGTFPALARELAARHTLTIGRFGGDGGGPLARAIEWRLGEPDAGGRPHYRLIPAGAAAEAVLEGQADSDVDYDRYKTDRERCAEKKDGKCVRKEKYSVACKRRTVSLDAHIRAHLVADEHVVYDVSKPRSDSTSWCEDDSSPQSVDSVLDDMVASIAQEVRTDIAPHTDSYEIRVREGRDGMTKEIGERFKQAVKLTKHDERAACAAFADLARDMPDNVSIVFNVALCAESAGEYDTAAAGYARAGQLLGKQAHDIDLGIERTRGLIVARQDAAARDGVTLNASGGTRPRD